MIKNIEAHAKKLIEKFDIRPNDSAKKAAKTLSGGNQQKVIIAREVTNDSDLLIAVNPTRGLDVGAIEFVHRYLVEQRNKDKAVLLVSFELDEIMNLSDRIEVIFDGQITGEVLGEDADEKELGLLMAGGKRMSKKNSILSSNAFYTLISIVIGFVVGAILLSIAKINPLDAYKQLFNGVFGKPKFMVWCLIYAAPLIFTGLSVAFSFKTGCFLI